MNDNILSAGRGALLLMSLSTLSQLLGFGYRVALSRMVGAQIMGLYQLIMPVYSVLLSLTAVGLTSAISNLTSQHLALGNTRSIAQTLSTCLRLFLWLLLPVGAIVIFFSDFISVTFLGDARTQLGLILLVPCVALTGVENIHKHFFYGSGRVGPPAVVDLLEQLFRAAAVLGLLVLFLPQHPERIVGLIVLGMVICEIFSALTLVVLTRCRLTRNSLSGQGEPAKLRRKRITAIALPVGVNALLGNLISSANAALIPQKLVEAGVSRADAIAELGIVCGMTLPMLALPTVFLGALNLVLVPRLARACALNQRAEVSRLAGRAVSVVSVLILPAMSLMVVLGPDLGRLLFAQDGVGRHLLPLAVTMALSCYCSVLCAILNGVGRQKEVAAVCLLGGAIQLILTLALVPLPGIGMGGYVAGALISALLEVALCLWLVLRQTGMSPQPFSALTAPGLASLLAALTANLLFRCLKDNGLPPFTAGLSSLLFALTLYLAALHAQGISLKDVLRIGR